jgi:predicted transcriptional regulator
LPKKRIVKVVLSKEQKEMLEELAKRLRTSESETMRMALMDYAKALSLLEERVRRRALFASDFDSKSAKSTT